MDSEKKPLKFLIICIFSLLNSRNETFIKARFQNFIDAVSPTKFNLIYNNKGHKTVSALHESYSNKRKPELIGNRGKSS